MLQVRAARAGGPEVLETLYPALPTAGPGEALVRHEAIGLNFIDTYHRSGLYPLEFPAPLGVEGSGRVEAIGRDVTGFAIGDRVAYAGPRGAYAEALNVPADRLVKLPAEVSTRAAAASMLKGMTAEFLLRRCFPLKAGDACLVWAASGGVGSILTQWAKAIGATVIGCVGSLDKVEAARRQGCDHVLLYKTEDVADRVKGLTGGRGVQVVYDGVGKASFEASIASLARRGMLVSFGNASGPAPAVEPLRLSRGGSLFLTRPTLYDYIATPEELQDSAAALFEVLKSGAVKVEIGAEYPLARAADAHRALEAGETTGSTLLIP